MSRTLFLLLALILTVAAPAFGQCDYRSVYSGAYRATALDLALDSSTLWLASSYGVVLYDRSTDPPVPVTSLALPGSTSEVEVVGQLAYVASGSTLFTLRRAGGAIEVVHSLDLGAIANDLVAVGQYLYIAASTGFVQVDLLLPDRPVVTNRLTTSSGSAFSVAHLNGVIYMADGDNSLQLYIVTIPSLPQKFGTLDTARPVTSVRVANNLVFVSDGAQTQIFAPDGPPLGTAPFGSVAAAPHSAAVIYSAGSDRRVRAVDVSAPSSPIVLFEQELPASSGTVNRVGDLIAADGRVYVAAGDLGLVTFDARQFTAPFPLRAYTFGPSRSAFSIGPRIFVSPEAGALREYASSDAGVLTFVRQWDDGRISTIHDGSSSRLVTSSGSTAIIWDTTATPPVALATASLRAAVRGAVLFGNSALVLLSDVSLWRVEAGQPPAQVPLGDARPSHIARGGSGLAMADLNESGTTTLRWFANGDPGSTPQVGAIEGAATSGIAATSSGLVAGVTFRGLLAVDFAASSAQVIQFPRQGGTPARDLYAEGDDLFVLTSTALELWDIPSRELRRTYTIPSTAAMVHASDFATVATLDGVVLVDYRAPSSQPQMVPFVETNAYYTAATGSAGSVHLVRDGEVKSFRVGPDGQPLSENVRSVPRASRDVAAIGDHLYAVSDSGKVTGAGAEFQLNEGADASPLALHAVGDALYLSIVRGCLSGGCEKKTIVLSTSEGTLTQTAALSGALVDVDVHGERAFALFDDPDEIRILNIQNAAQPTTIISRASEGNPVSIAYALPVSAVYTIGEKVYAYVETTLAKSGELLDAYTPDPTARVSYLDQELSLDGSCIVVAGREFSPKVFRIVGATQWESVAAPAVPAAVRAIVTVNGSHYLLSDYSLEIWSSAVPLKRTRPVR